MVSKYKNNLIFDFDGTLADTLAFTVNAATEINRSLHLLSDEKIDFEKFRSTDTVAFFNDLEIPAYKLFFFLYKYQRKQSKSIDKVKIFEELPEVLIELKKNDIGLGVATSNSTKNVKLFLNNNNIDTFDFIYSSIDYFHKNKIIEKAMKKYGMEKENVIYIGDEIRDVKAAKEAGIKVASVTWGYNFESVLSKYNPDFIINKPEELLNLFKS